MLSNPKWNEPTLTDFIDWLRIHDANETYNYADNCGDCLMAQYMASKGVEWSFGKYSEFCNQVFDNGSQSVLNVQPWTFGDALRRAIELSDTGTVKSGMVSYYEYAV